MNRIKVLDASLRDGGHRTNFHFTDLELDGILTPLDNSGVEYIEIGYRNGSLHPIENLGRAGYCAKGYLLYCRERIQKSKIAIMAHPHNIKSQDLDELKTCGVHLLRICVSKNELDKAIPLIKIAKKCGLQVSVNLIHLSYYNEMELDAAVAEITQHQPDLIYFADSNGSLLPQKIGAIYQKYTRLYSIPFGFHAHDNLGLAQANTLAAIDAGAQFIDASLAGMGKGIGNLRTEFFIAYLNAINHKEYNLEAALTAANYVRQALKIGHEAIAMDEFIRGISDLSTADLKTFKTHKPHPDFLRAE